MSEILKHGGNSPVTRMQSGIQLKNALYSKDSNIKAEYQQRWLTFPDDVRNVVKANVSILCVQVFDYFPFLEINYLFVLIW